MGNVTLNGSTSGQITLAPTAVAGTNTLTLPAVTGTVLASSSGTITVPSGSGTAAVQGLSTNIVSGTSQASTSGTSITFTSIPSWVRRITIMLQSVQTSGTSNKLFQLGTSGGFVTTGYLCTSSQNISGSSTVTQFTNGWPIASTASADVIHGQIILSNLNGNTWVGSGSFPLSSGGSFFFNAGSISAASLGGVLTQVRLTTVNGTDTFTAGNVNILYE